MRVRSFTLCLAVVMGSAAVGCKSAPKLPWFRTADKSADTAATLAQSAAPQLPSEIAKQAEALSADPVKITTPPAATTAAAPVSTPAYSATNIDPYPSTGIQSYLPSSSTVAAGSSATPSTSSATSTAASTSSAVASAAGGALPYNPDAVPPAAKATAASSPANTPSQDRYGLPAQDRYANAYPSTAAAPVNTAPTYPPVGTTADVAVNAESSAGVGSVPFASNPGSSSIGDRYATQNTPIAAPQGSTAFGSTPSVQPASAVASTQPYRPGGTSSYPGTSANYEVATRPGSTTSSTYPGQGTVYR